MLLVKALAIGPDDINSKNALITNGNRVIFRAAFAQTVAAAAGMKIRPGMAAAKT